VLNSRLLALLGGSKLLTLIFWRDVLARGGRQAQQALLPVFAAAALSGGLQGIDVRAAAVYLGGAELVVLIRALYELRLQNDAVDRVAAAFAGSLLGVVGAAGFNLLHTDWRTNLGVAGAAAATSLLQFAFDKLGQAAAVADDTSDVDAPVIPADPAGDEDLTLTPVDTVDFGGDAALEGDTAV
jgi:hypothetical protein